jgi:hypothetical protein
VNKENLIKLREIIIEAVMKSDVDLIDKLEVALNERQFLHPEKYENNVKVLQKELNETKYRK